MEYQDRHTNADTEVVGGGEYVEYGRVDFGPFTVEFERGSQVAPIQSAPLAAVWVIEGPMIGQTVEKSCYAIEVEMMDAIGTWDYVERCENEVQTK
jgi:hypothetical protein